MVSACVSLEPYVLRVLNDAMAPDVPVGAVVIVDPSEPVEDGCLVVLEHEGTVMLRRLRLGTPEAGADGARFVAPDLPALVPGGDWRGAVRGVVTAVRTPRGSAPARRDGVAPAGPRGG